uniref:Uncharacterized protein n=1 Tax=Panagrellus redivivus TaxID=6233 RepID=A0A7E4WC23_PANRE
MPFCNDLHQHVSRSGPFSKRDVVAEWLWRWTANPLGFSRVSQCVIDPVVEAPPAGGWTYRIGAKKDHITEPLAICPTGCCRQPADWLQVQLTSRSDSCKGALFVYPFFGWRETSTSFITYHYVGSSSWNFQPAFPALFFVDCCARQPRTRAPKTLGVPNKPLPAASNRVFPTMSFRNHSLLLSSQQPVEEKKPNCLHRPL